MIETMLMQQTEIATKYTKAFLSLGELIVADKPTQVWTILGSCVSIVLYNPRKKVSALCHAQLSERNIFGSLFNNQYTEKAVKDDFRFVGSSINYMLEQMLALGISKNEIVASVYGGANVIAEFTHKIGTENSEVAISELAKIGIRIVKKDVGGTKSRTIYHLSDTGKTDVKIL